MLTLGIETSCDETAAALIAGMEGQYSILAESLSSQSDIHERYGGVVPELASREHLTNLPIIVESVLKSAGKTVADLSCISVTRGPGLRGCLLVGLNFARGLSHACGTPIVGVNHIEAHIYAAMLDNPELKFPFIVLIVSGGHTEIHVARGLGKYELIARTMDDAAGEAFDKSATLLGFNYPGGASLAKVADSVSASDFALPKVMREAEGFSFSGLKTSIMLLVKKHERELPHNQELLAKISFSVQDAIVGALVYKLEQAMRSTGITTVAVTGGVSANQALRRRVAKLKGVKAYFPHAVHCTDNAAMVAYLGALRFCAGERMDPKASAMDRWPIEAL